MKNIPNVCFLIFVKKIRHVDIKGEKSHGSSTLHVKLQTAKAAESWRNSLPQGRAPRLVIQHQMVSPESIYIQVTLYELNRLYLYIITNICMCVCVFIHTHTYKTMKETEAKNLRQSMGGYRRSIGRRKMIEEVMQLYLNTQN